jgi:hypothetical protein
MGLKEGKKYKIVKDEDEYVIWKDMNDSILRS